MNGAINAPPPTPPPTQKKKESNFHSQLPKEILCCDAFLSDINQSREGVTERLYPEQSQQWISLKRGITQHVGPVKLFKLFLFIRGGLSATLTIFLFFSHCTPPGAICHLLQQYISDLCFVCTQFALPSVNGIECLNEIN